MSRRWIIPTAILGLLAIGLGVWGYLQFRENRALKIRLANNNRRTFLEAMNRVENVEVLLSKGIVSGKPEENVVILSDIWREADTAQENLIQLPVNNLNLARTSNFLNQLGDFAFSLVKKSSRGASVSRQEVAQLVKLHREVGVLSDNMHDIFNLAKRGQFDWATVSAATKARFPRRQPPSLPKDFEKVDKTMQEFPTMAYDGPFSDHIQNRSPKGLTGPVVSAQQAGATARGFLANRRGVNYVLRSVKKVGGKIPAYRASFAYANRKTPEVFVDISRKGGHPIWLVNSRAPGSAQIGVEEAVSIAGDFLKDKGFPNMVATYSIRQQNTVTVTFAGQQDKIILYPDQVKVMIAMDNGEIIGYEAMSYLMAHTDRKLPEPKLTVEKAGQAVNDRIQVNNTRLALIPLESGQEILCWEFRGDVAGEDFLVYINALNGTEERILKIIKSPQGQLAM